MNVTDRSTNASDAATACVPFHETSTSAAARSTDSHAPLKPMDSSSPPYNRPTLIDDYRLYLHHRWMEGCTNASTLTREIQRLGHRGDVNTVRRHLKPYRSGAIPATAPLPHLTLRGVTGWITRRPEHLTDVERKGLKELCERNPALETTAEYARRLALMIRDRRSEHLALDSGSPTSASTANANSELWPTACDTTAQPSRPPSPRPTPPGRRRQRHQDQAAEEADVRPRQLRSLTAPHPAHTMIKKLPTLKIATEPGM
ncbi:hypothetical protein ACIO87_37470 [Streptomyces sp. NPDC087218]|uniref:hypothetical protein n=1 Tax=Streptomyces sp. NPDC087218 TaxID=3365769 RepID=UPI0037F55590